MIFKLLSAFQPTGSDTNSSLPDTVTYSVTDCRIINEELSIEFPILEDGCGQDLVGFDFEDTSAWPIDASLRPIHNADSVYFEYMSFRFVSAEKNVDYNEKLSCDVSITISYPLPSIFFQTRPIFRSPFATELMAPVHAQLHQLVPDDEDPLLKILLLSINF